LLCETSNIYNNTDPSVPNEQNDPISDGSTGQTWNANWLTGYLGAPNNTYMNGAGIGTGSGQLYAATGVHSNGANFLLGDGHVKWMYGSSVSPGFDAATSTTPATTNGGNSGQSTAAGTDVVTYQATFSAI
jgi:prepilin-type processing-associated H-X9-DG protein